MEQGMQLIDGNGKFNMDGLKDFMTATEFAQSGLSYAIVAIIGSQSSGHEAFIQAPQKITQRYGLLVPIPLEYFKTSLLEDIEKIWAAVAEPETLISAPLREFFNI